jgi:hypothetical protein
MSFREAVTQEVQEVAERTSSEPQETLEQIEVDFGSMPFVKFYPTTLVAGTFPADEGNPIIRFPDESNNDGRRDQGYLGLVLDDLHVITDEDEGLGGARIVKTDDEDYTEYRIVNFDDEQTTEKYDGDAVSISGAQYGVDEIVTKIEGRSILVVDRTASVSVARKLDVNGDTLAGMDETTGNVNGGLIERNPELREELYGAEVGIMVTRRSEVDEDFAELVHDESTEARDMMWYTVFDMETEEPITPTTGEPVGYSFLEWRFDPTAGNLPDQDWEFVQEYISNGLPDDEDNIIQNIEDNSDRLSADPNVDRMVGLIQAKAGQ